MNWLILGMPLKHSVSVQVRFERGTVATPELLQDIELPSSISVLGQPVDLTNLKAGSPRSPFIVSSSSDLCCFLMSCYSRPAPLCVFLSGSAAGCLRRCSQTHGL